MVTFQRAVFYLMIPMHLLGIAWVWLGRLFFGIGGWMLIIFTFTAVPVMLIGLTLTTLLAFTQRIPAARGRLDLGQAITHVALWAAIFGFGFVVTDATDESNSDRSIYMFATGDQAPDRSFELTPVLMWAAIALYVLLLVLLIVGQRNRSRTRTGPYGPQHPERPPSPQWW